MSAAGEPGSGPDPRRWARWAVLPVLLACCTGLVALRGHALTSASIDFVWHLVLTSWIAAHDSVPVWRSFDPSESLPVLSTMTFYPPVAHLLAALLGKLLGSSVFGLSSVAVLSIFLWYAVVFHPLIRGGGAVAALVFGAVAVLLSTSTFAEGGYALHGGEIRGNFFFAQICGTALAATFLYACVATLDGWAAVAAACVCAYLLAWTYLLSEVEFAAGFLVSLAWGVAQDVLDRRGGAPRKALRFAAAAAALGALTALHPQVRVMRLIAGNDGAIAPFYEPSTVVAVAAATLVVALAVLFLARGRTSVAFLCCLCAGASAVALLQDGLLVGLKLGSPYAVRKTTFDVFTSAALLLSVLAGLASHRVVRVPRASAPAAALAAMVLAAAVTLAVSDDSLGSARPFARTLRTAQRVMASAVPPDAASRTVAFLSGLAADSSLDPILDVALQTVAFQVPVEQSIAFTFNNDTAAARYAAVATGSALAGAPGCARSSPADVGIVLVDLRCALSRGGPDVFGFVPTTEADGHRLQLATGWAAAEPDGTWSSGTASTLRLAISDVPSSSPVSLTLTLADVFVLPSHPTQRVVVSVDGHEVGERTFRSDEPVAPVVVTIPADLVAAGLTTVTLAWPDAVSPSSLLLSADTRALAVKLAGFQVAHLPEQANPSP